MPSQNDREETDEQLKARGESARLASRGCPYCGGEGIVTVYHPTFTGDSVGITKDGRRYPATVSGHCRCDLGVFMRSRTPPDIQARIPRVDDIRARQSRWLLEPPGEIDQDPRRPVRKEDFDEFWRKVKSRPALKEVDQGAAPKQTAWSIETALRKRLARELGVDERVADVLTIDDLLKIKESRTR